ncbi:voltage-dependent calcium channel beta subunit-associated regulatory protein-like [Cyclopterus lumpus]|uniref:voltage-dependent calcium channel beta subunit-associated regulatory protein-like n=1 Tax=Cyclopterus lumpus TaxID=8103 RepID=UPI001485DCC1|nr:voltage-dependent calcium channel beta subunit-associated regulatory protein-like [Cyclopterus lumpus]XP_034412334.1 voltage-dependent calcium channel beta subunit-associated regulatory protein-like [Cyclopterus lumpus]XP_034412335.1 voltage-dependent calcium channel beta subunit-associated regulatory protein-like [Cyclopterus lumpus]
MSNDLPVLTSLTENSTDVPVAAGQVENYVLLLVLLSVFAGGTLVLLSLLLLFCHRCCMGGRRYSRASDDPEKTNTTYAEDSQPTQEITIHLDESDALSAASCHDGESERFVSTGSTGRRVSFNESALYEQEKTTQDKGRRYTLTEGDFHHLKKARLTHLHLPPAPCDLKILTIMECDSTESSTVNINETAAPKLPLTIYKPTERRVPDWMGLSLSGGLPGDPHHSTILDQSPRQASSAMKAQHSWSQTMEAIGDRGEAESESGMRGESIQAPDQTSVLHFFSKLRRHASLEGAGPYFRKWKFDSSHRAASLDAKGSPKRRPFQRQRAASETTDHSDDDSLSLRDEVIELFPQSPVPTSGLQSLSAESLSQPDTALTSSIFLSRLNLEAMVELGGSSSTGGEDLCSPTIDCRARRQDEATANGTRVEKETKFSAGTRTEAVGVRRSVEDDDLFEVQRRTAVQDRFEDMLRTTEDTQTSAVRTMSEADDGDELVLGAEARLRAGSGSSLSFMTRQESSEAPPSLYRDIWSLRASLEQYASSDQSSTDRESIRSDGDSVSSHGGAGARSGLDSCLSQDLDDEAEGEGEGEMLEGGIRGASGGHSEVESGAGGEGESGNRKLLQMDSGYASIEAPSRAPEEMRLFGTPGAPRGKSASERRLFYTSSGRKGSVCESVEAKLFQEELEDEMADGTVERSQTGCQSLTLQEPHELLKSLQPQKPPESQSQLMSPLIKPIPQPSTPHKTRLRRRDYSIDEKTDALFNEFLRHDPRFDQQDSPLRSRHRSRVHLRKQWQRHKQYSDPGSGAGGRYSPSLERQRFTPLRRGDSAGYPLDTRYHSTLSRIASAADEEACEVAACEEAAKESTEDNDPSKEGGAREAAGSTADATKSWAESTGEGDGCQVSTKKGAESTTIQSLTSNMDPRVNNRNNNSSQAILSESSLTDKLAVSVEERLYGGLRSAEKLGQGGTERALTGSHTASPGFSPM